VGGAGGCCLVRGGGGGIVVVAIASTATAAEWTTPEDVGACLSIQISNHGIYAAPGLADF
jgi:hypothetical protein